MQPELRLALYQPDQPANTGAIMRLCACLGVALDIIEPCGFVFDDRKLRRVAMDYIDHLSYQRHQSWNGFTGQLDVRRLVLLTTKADMPYHQFAYRSDDVLMVGRESAGVPEEIHARADARITIPMQAGLRSLNVGMAAAMVVGEALRQLNNVGQVNGDIFIVKSRAV
jgi:tRNA (cytidine/uridine-2'-O-)-methyltransferase